VDYTIDAKKFYAHIANLSGTEERGNYILKISLYMQQGIADEPWMITRPVKKSRKKGEVYNRPYTDEFEAFWKAYPKKSGKGGAFEIWEKLKFEKEVLCNLCLKALLWQNMTEGWIKDHGEYIPKAENYLKGRCWEDENPNLNKPEGAFDLDGVWREA
jgi:hypothetical protein